MRGAKGVYEVSNVDSGHLIEFVTSFRSFLGSSFGQLGRWPNHEAQNALAGCVELPHPGAQLFLEILTVFSCVCSGTLRSGGRFSAVKL